MLSTFIFSGPDTNSSFVSSKYKFARYEAVFCSVILILISISSPFSIIYLFDVKFTVAVVAAVLVHEALILINNIIKISIFTVFLNISSSPFIVQ